MKRLHAALGLLLLTPPLAAQSPGDRQALVAFRDTLYRIEQADSLTALEVPRKSWNADKSRAAFQQLRNSFLLLRWADLTDEFAYLQMAAGDFHELTDHHSDWPWAWFGHGLAELGQVEGQLQVVINLQLAFGKDPLKRAKANIARSVEVDSLFAAEVASFITAAVRQQQETPPRPGTSVSGEPLRPCPGAACSAAAARRWWSARRRGNRPSIDQLNASQRRPAEPSVVSGDAPPHCSRPASRRGRRSTLRIGAAAGRQYLAGALPR